MLIREIAAGYVSTRRNARLHLNRDGVAACGSGRRRELDTHPLDTDHMERICRRCSKAIRNQLAMVLSGHARRRANCRDAELTSAVTEAIDSLATDGERDSMESMREGIRAILATPIALSARVLPDPVDDMMLF